MVTENLSSEEIFLLATDSEGRTVVHVAEKYYKLDVFQGILNLAK